MPAHLTRINPPPCVVCGAVASQELIDTFNTPLNYYCDRDAPAALHFQRMNEEAAVVRSPTCPRCKGPVHAAKRTMITSPEDDLWNDRIEFECERRILARMARP
jgi:hypothetical protein